MIITENALPVKALGEIIMDLHFSELHKNVCFKKSGGKVIWQPRIGCWIQDKLFEHGELPGIYKGMSQVDLYQELGCSARIYDYNACFQNVYDGGISYHQEKKGNTWISRFETPIGSVTHKEQETPNSWAKLVTKEWIVTEEDMTIFTYIEQHTNWVFLPERYEQIRNQWGDLGAPVMYMPRVSIQRLYIDLMGVEETVYALEDYPETVELYFEALRSSQMRLVDVICDSPIELINFGDNLHCGTLSPSLFEKYVLPEYQLRCDRLHQAGKFVYSHFDGDNKSFLPYYQQTGLDGIEAITPVPQGDVTLEEVKEAMGDMILLDGIPAIYFDDTYSEEVLIECVHKLLDLFAPNLVLGISDEISSTGDIERIRLVGKIVDEYNARFDETALSMNI